MTDTITSTCQTLAEVLTEYAPTGDTTGVWEIRTSLSIDKTERYVMLAVPVGADAGFNSAQKWAMFLDWGKLEKEYRDRSSHWSDDPRIAIYDWDRSIGGNDEV